MIWKVMVGLAALICTVVLLILAAARDRQAETPARETKDTGAEILFETEELVYDGEGMLDLMEGVSARDRDGNDLTDLVEVSLLADDRLTAKRIQYRLFDENGAEVASGNWCFPAMKGQRLQQLIPWNWRLLSCRI